MEESNTREPNAADALMAELDAAVEEAREAQMLRVCAAVRNGAKAMREVCAKMAREAYLRTTVGEHTPASVISPERLREADEIAAAIRGESKATAGAVYAPEREEHPDDAAERQKRTNFYRSFMGGEEHLRAIVREAIERAGRAGAPATKPALVFTNCTFGPGAGEEQIRKWILDALDEDAMQGPAPVVDPPSVAAVHSDARGVVKGIHPEGATLYRLVEVKPGDTIGADDVLSAKWPGGGALRVDLRIA